MCELLARVVVRVMARVRYVKTGRVCIMSVLAHLEDSITFGCILFKHHSLVVFCLFI